MDTEVLDASETPQQEEAVMEKEVVSKLEAAVESTEPEKPPAAGEEPEQPAVNGHDAQDEHVKVTEELVMTENVTQSEEKTEMEIEKSELEPVPGAAAAPEPDESSEKICDPVAALETEPENSQPEQQPVPENDPEPEPVQTPLAESAPVPEPEKPAESLPEAELQEQTSPEPVAVQQPVETQPPSQEEEKVSGQVEAMNTVAEEAAKEPEAAKDVAAEPAKEEGEEKTVVVGEVPPEKPTEAATLKEESSAEPVKSEEDKKEVEPEKPDAPAGAAAAAAAAAGEGETVKSEQNNVEPEEEEDTAPAPGSLSFALLEQDQTKDALRSSRTLIVLRGLPGSGKSFLARAIADTYKDHCSVVRADDHGVKPESPESSADAYKALDEAVVTCCGTGATSSVLIVVDDTNHTQDRLARLGEIAEEHHLVVIFLEPKTEWSRDPAQLAKKSRRGLEEAQLEAMKASLEEMTIPLYFGWFLLSSVQDKVRCTSMDFLKTLDTLEVFKKHIADFAGKAEKEKEKEVDLEQYFEAKGNLHCTTKFCDYGKAEGAKEYALKPAVKDFYGSSFELSLSALFVTPRTVGARVSLTEEQLQLWPDDAEKEEASPVPAATSLPLGSRAHVTLGCAKGVEPIQTGLDLLEITALQQDGQQREVAAEMELGQLTYYDEGRWLLQLREPICVPACFSSCYRGKEQELTKKEPEKKKKQKCTIL